MTRKRFAAASMRQRKKNRKKEKEKSYRKKTYKQNAQQTVKKERKRDMHILRWTKGIKEKTQEKTAGSGDSSSSGRDGSGN